MGWGKLYCEVHAGRAAESPGDNYKFAGAVYRYIITLGEGSRGMGWGGASCEVHARRATESPGDNYKFAGAVYRYIITLGEGSRGMEWGGASCIVRFTPVEQQNPQEITINLLEQYTGTLLPWGRGVEGRGGVGQVVL